MDVRVDIDAEAEVGYESDELDTFSKTSRWESVSY
jgi:hypothetical protein